MEQLRTDIFNILKGADLNIVLYTDAGQKTLDPDAATRFYNLDGDMMITINRENANTEVVVQVGSDFDLDKNKSLLASIKNTVHNVIGEYTLRRFDKNIEPKDFSHTTVSEGYSKPFGSIKTSYVQMESARLIIKHNKSVNEEVRGSRSRNIHSLFVENAEGERQKFPYKYMAGAKAMTMHVNNGGTFEDVKGTTILEMCGEISELNQFVRHVTKNKLVNEGNVNVVETVRARLSELKQTVRGLQTIRGYNSLEVNELQETEEKVEKGVDIASRFVYDTFETVNMDTVLSTVSRIVTERENMDQFNKETLANLYSMIKDNQDFSLSLDVNDPENPNNEDPVKYSGSDGPMAKVSAMLSYLAKTTKNDDASNIFGRLSTAIYEMDKPTVKLVVKVLNHILKTAYKDEIKQVESSEVIAEIAISDIRKKIA